MSVEPGGIASKLGIFYERQYAVELALKLLAGRLRRIKWEPQSAMLGGADIEVEHPDRSVELIQLKRQNGCDAAWTVAELAREHVWQTAATWLDKNPQNRFTFASSDPVPHIKDICDRLPRHDGRSAADFVADHIRNHRDRQKSFQELLQRWDLDGASQHGGVRAIERLKRMQFIVLDRSPHGESQLQLGIQTALTGDPDTALRAIESYLEDHLNIDVTPDALTSHLNAQGFKRRDLQRCPTLPGAVNGLRSNFEQSLREHLVDGTWLQRPEAGRIVAALTGQHPPKIVLIHGKPGTGKSAVLLKVIEELQNRELAVLPLSMASQPPSGSLYTYGKDLGLDASPAAAIRGVAGHGKAVLLIDQLDALRLTTNQSTAVWQLCQQVMREGIADGSMTVMVACRTFDLRSDPNIIKWSESIEKNNPGGVLQVEVGLLEAPVIEPVLSSYGVTYSALPPRMQQLLRHPNTLAMWTRLAARGCVQRQFTTATQLLAQLTESLRKEASRDHHVAESDVTELVESVRKHMESTGTLSVPLSALPQSPSVRDAVCSVGLLVRNGRTLSFPHQSYYDHLVASAALRAAGSSHEQIVEWVKQDQSLQRRDQLRQMLLLLREEQPEVACRVASELLSDEAIRFHLKLLLLGVLREATPPSEAEVRLVEQLATQPEWWDHIRARVLWNSPEWFDALYRRGTWQKWIQGGYPAARREVMRLLQMVMPKRPTDVDALLAPLLQDGSWLTDLEYVASSDPAEDSPLVSAWRNEQLRRGKWSIGGYTLNQFARSSPLRALELLDACIRGALRRRAAPERPESPLHTIRAGFEKKHIEDAVTSHPEFAWRHLGRLLRLVNGLRTRAKEQRGTRNVENTIYAYSSDTLDQAEDLLTPLVALAVGALSTNHRGLLVEVLRRRRNEGLEPAIAAGLSTAPVEIADLAIAWLAQEPRRFSLRLDLQYDKHALAASVIRRHAAACSGPVLDVLEETLLTHYPSHEKTYWKLVSEEARAGEWGYFENGRYVPRINEYGRAQHMLMSAIPEERRSARVRARLAVWTNKFYGPPKERPGMTIRGGAIGSPIPHSRLQFVSDREWRKIASGEWEGGNWKQIGPDQLAESSHRHFSNDFGTAASKDPRRFVALALTFPQSSPLNYFESLLRALSAKDTPLHDCDHASLEQLLERVAAGGDRDSLVAGCWFLESHADLPWGESAWRLIEAAANHAEPGPAEYTVHNGARDSMKPDLEGTSINCARGVAATAIKAMIWDNPARIARAWNLIQKLVQDPHPAVRMEAASMATAVYHHDSEKGLDLLLKVVDHPDDRVLSGKRLNELMTAARWYKPGCLSQVFTRMALSANDRVSRMGAGWITAEHIQFGTMRDDYATCRDGSVAQRQGVAETLINLVDDDRDYFSTVMAELVRFFSDPDKDVRNTAGSLFLRDKPLQSKGGPQLAAALVNSPAFLEDPQHLVWALDRKALDLLPYTSTVLALADRFAAELAPDTRGWQSPMAMIGKDVSSLLFKLYDGATKAGDHNLANRCLDRWDRLLKARVGDAEQNLEGYEA